VNRWEADGLIPLEARNKRQEARSGVGKPIALVLFTHKQSKKRGEEKRK
jgi:hypothetical protein